MLMASGIDDISLASAKDKVVQAYQANGHKGKLLQVESIQVENNEGLITNESLIADFLLHEKCPLPICDGIEVIIKPDTIITKNKIAKIIKAGNRISVPDGLNIENRLYLINYIFKTERL